MNRCRLCLEKRGGVVMIREKNFNDKLGKVFQIQFMHGENFPERACDACFLKVQDFYAYTEQVDRAQKQLIDEQQSNSCDMSEIKWEIDVKDESIHGAEQTEKEHDINFSPSVPQTESALLDEQSTDPHIEIIEMVNINDMESPDDTESESQKCKSEVHVIDDGNVDNTEEVNVDSISLEKAKKRNLRAASSAGKALKKPADKRIEEDNRIKEFFSMKCEVCTEEPPTFFQLQIHYRKIHNLRGFIRCCNQKFYRKFKVLDHISFHVTPDAYRCEMCQKSYRSRYTLRQHNDRSHSESKERPFKCDVCHQAYEKEYQLKSHISRHIKSPCHLCGRVMSSVQALRVHLSHMHGDNEQQICDACGEMFRTKPALERHIRRHLGQEVVAKRQCPQCGVWLNGTRGLKIHTRNVHPDKHEIFECNICKQRCKNATTLYQHRKGVHADDQYQCDLCGKRFKRKIYLKEHRASHSGQSLYSCDICGLKTNSNANMYSHKKNKHPHEWREAQLKKQLASAAAAERSLAAKETEQN